MKKRASLLAAVAASSPAAAPAKKPKRHFIPGCLTERCNDRIGAIWAAHHPKPKARMASAVASWYGPGFYGNKTACGQVLTPRSFGVAHKWLACGTRVRLCVKRCVVAPVIDRGPYAPGRTFDLTVPVRDAIGAGSLGSVRYVVVGG